ncbi:SCO2525 family SAM-dependent methyltransferase [Dactylosporangium sp. NPDC006015]|uniref:SCO2525 family SAM-dependent methyltransferase n=1 Tax=Dactylosporangium sp. NPDC006015 TaxID=3154576 RepID=UPI0033ABD1A4
MNGAAVLECARNGQADWRSFDAEEYRNQHYKFVRDDDRQIMGITRDFFARAGVSGGRALDLGTGTNLYPALSMMPFSRSLTLREYSPANLAWLAEHQRAGLDRGWDAFWDVFLESPAYRRTDPRAKFAAAKIQPGSVFTLPRHRFDLGTMFFVACSISSDPAEFELAIQRFVGALRPDAPFVAAFMRRSSGYEVAGRRFPAVPVDESDVHGCLSPLTTSLRVIPVESDMSHADGMIVATGRTRSSRRRD